MVYGARLESVLGASPHEFKSRILRHQGFGFAPKPFFFLKNGGIFNDFSQSVTFT